MTNHTKIVELYNLAPIQMRSTSGLPNVSRPRPRSQQPSRCDAKGTCRMLLEISGSLAESGVTSISMRSTSRVFDTRVQAGIVPFGHTVSSFLLV